MFIYISYIKVMFFQYTKKKNHLRIKIFYKKKENSVYEEEKKRNEKKAEGFLFNSI